jgi:hypothetical protein
VAAVRRILTPTILTLAMAAAVMGLAPSGNAITVPAMALLLAFDIQIWIVRPRLVQESDRRGDPSTTEYLATLDSSLELPADLRAEIRAELADHVSDTVAALRAEGLEEDQAVREALARLGKPKELARQLTAAHRSPRRLLAAAAGGIWTAGWSAAQAWLVATGLLAIVLILGSALVQKPFDQVSNFWTGYNFLGSSGSTGYAAAFNALALVPAFVAGRRGARAAIRLGRRSPLPVRLAWAVAGSTALLLLLLFVVDTNQSWLVAGLELGLPLAFGAGALIPDVALRLPKDRPRRLIAGASAILICAVITGSLAQVGTPIAVGFPSTNGEGYGRIAPLAVLEPCSQTNPGPILDNGTCSAFVGSDPNYDEPLGPNPRFHLRFGLSSATALAGYGDVRLEVWKATLRAVAGSDYPTYGVDPAQSGPYLVVAAVISGAEVDVQVDLGRSRTTRWVASFTGIASDGVRYRLGLDWPIETDFTGTAWDWLTASD